MKTIIKTMAVMVFTVTVMSTHVKAQASAQTDTTKHTPTKLDSTKAKIIAKIDTIKNDVNVAFDSMKDSVNAKTPVVKQAVKQTINKAIDKVTPDKPTEVATINTANSQLTITAIPTEESVFHKGSLLVGMGLVYQKELLPIMLSGEYGIGKNIGVEVRTWYGSKTTDGVRYRDGLFGVGLNYHFTGDISRNSGRDDRFDAYVGGLYGKILDDTGSALYAQAGGRYFFFKKLGAFANFNIGLIGNRGTNLSVGLAYRIF